MKCVPWRWGQFLRRKTTWHQWPIRNQDVNRLPEWSDIDSVRRWVKFPVDKRNIGSRHPDSGSVWAKTNNRFLKNCFLNSHADGVVVLLFSVIRHPSIRIRIQRSRELKTNATGLTIFSLTANWKVFCDFGHETTTREHWFHVFFSFCTWICATLPCKVWWEFNPVTFTPFFPCAYVEIWKPSEWEAKPTTHI